MGFGYADKLAYREDLGGSLGDEELEESPEAQTEKIRLLRRLIQSSSKIVAFTGAGISKAAGVPDFRGPNGIWTLQRLGLPTPDLEIEFGAAKPTVTHQALVALQATGQLTCVISQNVDGLHSRSGIERERLAELHGSCFVEKCGRCGREFIRDFEMNTVGFKRTGRKCDCGGALRDQVLDWESALPEEDYQRALRAARGCDLMVVLGSSLRITPACDLPGEALSHGANLAIINLQRTQLDKEAEVLLHAKCEDVMGQMGLQLPDFRRSDRVKVTFTQEEGPLSSKSTGFLITVSSCASHLHVTPLLRSIDITMQNDNGSQDDQETITIARPPFQVRYNQLHRISHHRPTRPGSTSVYFVTLATVKWTIHLGRPYSLCWLPRWCDHIQLMSSQELIKTGHVAMCWRVLVLACR